MIETGSHVLISGDLQKTKREHDLDSSGHMLKMKNLIFEVKSGGNNSIEIYCQEANRTFTFCVDDVTCLSDYDELDLPERIIEFDPKNLDI